jgi:hypothetical protein
VPVVEEVGRAALEREDGQLRLAVSPVDHRHERHLVPRRDGHGGGDLVRRELERRMGALRRGGAGGRDKPVAEYDHRVVRPRRRPARDADGPAGSAAPLPPLLDRRLGPEAAPPRRLRFLAEALVLHVEDQDAVQSGAAFGGIEHLRLGAAEVSGLLGRRTADLVGHAAVVPREGAELGGWQVEQRRLLAVAGGRGGVGPQPAVPAGDADVGQLAEPGVKGGRILGSGQRAQNREQEQESHVRTLWSVAPAALRKLPPA